MIGILNKISVLTLIHLPYSLPFFLLLIISTYPKVDSRRISHSRTPIRLQVMDSKHGLKDVEMQNNGSHYFFYPISPDGKVLPKDPLLEDPEPEIGRWIQAERSISSEEELENFSSSPNGNLKKENGTRTNIDTLKVKSPVSQEKSFFNQSNLEEMGQSFNTEVEGEKDTVKTQLLDSNSNGNASTLTVDHLVFELQANIPNPEENNLAAQLIKISSPLGFEKLKKFNHGFNFKRILENHKKPYYKVLVNGKLMNITQVFRKNPNSKQVNVIFVKYNEMQNPRPITKQLRESFAKNRNFRKGKGPPSPTSLPKSHILNETENPTCISFQTFSDRKQSSLAIVYGKSQSSCPKDYPCQRFNSCYWWTTGIMHDDFTLNQPVYLSYLVELFKGIEHQSINLVYQTFERCYSSMHVLDTPEYISYRNRFTKNKNLTECENRINLFRSCLLLTESKGVCSNKV